MRTSFILFAILAGHSLLRSLVAGEPVTPSAPPIIPAPDNYSASGDVFLITPKTRIVYRVEAAAQIAEVLRLGLADRIGLNVSTTATSESTAMPGDITLEIVPPSSIPSQAGHSAAEMPEGYTLDVFRSGVTLRASSLAGLYYGVQSLLQLAGPLTPDPAAELSLPAIRIADRPRFAWRGLLLDESRHFFGKQTVLELLDLMAHLKLNRFHWHLTDEPGWRIEIKKYPKLTEIGAIGNWSDPKAPPQFYTQADIREIVAYAQQRQIVIVPEIDMPGHASAACRAYPELSGGGAPPYVGFTFNPARENTYRFLEDVLKEIVSLFPGPYIHIGGDEVHFGNQSWRTDPEIVKFTHDHDLSDAIELERYFIRRMAAVVQSLGKTVMGWDEIAGSGMPVSNTIVVWWRHDKPQVLEQLLRQDYSVVLSPRIPCYFDFVQDASHTHGRRWKDDFNELERVYDFPDVKMERLIPTGKEPKIIGIEACLWTERIQNRDRLWFMTLPRLAAFAEAAWTPAVRKDRAGFIGRLRGLMRELDRRGLPYFNPFAPANTPEPAGPAKRAAGTANG